MKAKKRIYAVCVNLIAWVLSLICLVPLLIIIINSLKDKNAAAAMNLALPKLPIMWENFSVVIEKGKLLTSFGNSVTYSVGSVLLCIVTAVMAAYVLSRNATKLNKMLYLYIALGITLPVNYVALMKVMQFFHINNTKPGIILLYTAMQLPFAVFLVHGFIARIPIDLDEAAIIDGCGSIKLFFLVILPLLKPVLATVFVLTFLNTWNEFVSPLYFLGSSEKWPMTLSVYNFFGMYFMDWNLVCADILLTSLPVIIVYLLGQKYIVTGMTAGAVKG
ncbi:MAG: carbohydrate ABC transporter permease [Eubacterium sp.]|nr:carbohydrate ABC transporter permease [Eubacterium sp.]